MTIIKAGYRITVESWENDGDNTKTETQDGFTLEEAKFHIELFKLFYSQNQQAGCFGNMYEPSEHEMERMFEAVSNVIAKHPCSSEFFEVFDDETLDDVLHDQTMNILYEFGLSGGEFFTRVLESFTVEFIPNDIEIKDVTYEFQ